MPGPERHEDADNLGPAPASPGPREPSWLVRTPIPSLGLGPGKLEGPVGEGLEGR